MRRFYDCLETDVALARWDAQREWKLWLTILRRMKARHAERSAIDVVRLWLSNAKYKCRTLRLEQRA